MRIRTAAAGLAVAMAWGLAAAGAHAAPSLSGFWKMDPPTKAPAPQLKAAAKAAMSKIVREGDTDVEANKWCVHQGMPHVMDSAGPIDIIQGGQEITILTEVKAEPRHIYIDGRKHVDPDIFDFAVNGNSVGRWQGDTLIVDTVSFKDGIGPFGAPRTTRTHLVERFKVAGDKLTVTSTWSDPKTYAKPFTYALTYRRLPADYTAQGVYCDPRENGMYLPGALR
jgi:hypothetical protein